MLRDEEWGTEAEDEEVGEDEWTWTAADLADDRDPDAPTWADIYNEGPRDWYVPADDLMIDPINLRAENGFDR